MSIINDHHHHQQRIQADHSIYINIKSGDCARHFQHILSKFPPQVSTRSAAAAWACHVHNEVNKSLRKALFDCSSIGDFYDCGCAAAEQADDEGSSRGAPEEMSERPLRPGSGRTGFLSCPGVDSRSWGMMRWMLTGEFRKGSTAAVDA